MSPDKDSVDIKNTHLVLLVGTNPLPNYVVASLLKDSISKISLIYSENTNDQKGTRDLKNYLLNEIRRIIPEITCYEIPLNDISSSARIRQDLTRYLKISSNECVHLNYTGGTKPMSVHVYNYIKQNWPDALLSYVDPRKDRLMYDGSSTQADVNLRDTVKIDDINTLLYLHGYERKNSKNEDVLNCTNPLGCFKEIIKKDKQKDYIEWRDKYLRPIFWSKRDKFLETPNEFKDNMEDEDRQDVSRLISNFKNGLSVEIRNLLNSFEDVNKIIDSEGNLLVAEICSSKRSYETRVTRSVKEFLDGKWLEYVVKDEIENMNKEKKLHCVHSLLASKLKAAKTLELDLAIIRGFQLTGISVTTESKMGMCKMKAFEVIHRTSQLGGDESRACLVTALDTKKIAEFKDDILFLTGGTEEHFEVIGIEDWNCVGKRVEKFVFQGV